jgi:hypothetical protein
MPTPDTPVVLNHDLWDAVAEGLVVSSDLSPSLRLRESFSAALPVRGRTPLQPLQHDWRVESARLRAGTPFGRQLVSSPGRSPSPSSTASNDISEQKENVELNLLRGELRAVEVARAKDRSTAARRERALLKVVEGLCEYQRARSPR